jgi:hypothetical protein
MCIQELDMHLTPGSVDTKPIIDFPSGFKIASVVGLLILLFHDLLNTSRHTARYCNQDCSCIAVTCSLN